MSDTTTEPAAQPEASEEKRIDTLESKVDRILDMLSGSGSSGPGSETTTEEPPVDPKAEMRSELAKLQAAEKRKQAAAEARERNESRLKAIEEKLTEKPPREYKRSTRFMRWEDKKDAE